MASLGWDKGQIYSTSVLPAEQPDETRGILEGQYNDFIQNFRLDNDYIYRDQLRQNLMVKEYFLEIDLGHLISYNEGLAQSLQDSPTEHLPLFESAVRTAATKILYPGVDAEQHAPECQVTLKSNANIVHLRDLNSTTISKLVRVAGIVIGASTLTSKATHIQVMCKGCRQVKLLPVSGGFSGVTLPRTCDNQPPENERKECPLDPYVIIHDKSKFVDQQTLKLQELPDLVRVGELPRHTLLSADRYLTNKVVPGTRVNIIGIFSIFQSKNSRNAGAVAIRTPYIRVVGIQPEIDGQHRGHINFTEREEEEFIKMSRNANLYDMFSSSIAPAIYGNQDIKKAITCLLFSGSKKVLPDGMKLRGDLNVLLLGDPSTAKSQLLKFAEKVAPISVYTSGKGSSAAGLTASVIRDSGSSEFYLEGGAMVLADGGIVCIDEFDKMREEDRVAIHEAMEQQTISIAKAGITTILNSRTSVLAAANPIFGRYNDLKTPKENIDFQTTILSRFDMIFIVRDEHNEQRDKTIARHVMHIHMNKADEDATVGEISIDRMRGYISYCKSKCAPRLSTEAAERLSSYFVTLRKDVHEMERQNNSRSSIPITVRQLEAIVRISESLAKMTLSPVATEQHVEEAIRLFKFSTMNAVQAGNLEGFTRVELMNEVKAVEKDIRRRIPIGNQTRFQTLRDDFLKQGISYIAFMKALTNLTSRDVLQYRNQRRDIVRIGM
ncbi:minichromosome maintenance protein 5 [Basidiobolus ranarum]|uniref:DNA replication licensing factor MCM5 n=1 Tax=Basidiobolus ranarum TaxID=34480 RepID=A0ABR2W6C9_9FUNG